MFPLARLPSPGTAKRTAIPNTRADFSGSVNLNLPFMLNSERGTCAWVQANHSRLAPIATRLLCTSTKMHDRRSFDWDDLKPFLAVARAGSTLGADKLLGVSQPTFSGGLRPWRNLLAASYGEGREFLIGAGSQKPRPLRARLRYCDQPPFAEHAYIAGRPVERKQELSQSRLVSESVRS